jgi:S1-C subfamily serine protease
VCLVVTLPPGSVEGQVQDLNTVLMNSTVRIYGPSAFGFDRVSTATGFIMGVPREDGSGQSWLVLITAKHVFDDIRGDEATLVLRAKDAEAATGYARMTVPLTLRKESAPLWTSHPTQDVAAMYVSVPSQAAAAIQTASTRLLGTDDVYRTFEIHPGDELTTLGYPYGVETPLGFAILRKGSIASYPLSPAKTIGSILLDIEVIDGNSGGPVYYSAAERYFGGRHQQVMIQFIAGILTGRVRLDNADKTSLRLASVVPAQFIKETIDLLPPRQP